MIFSNKAIPTLLSNLSSMSVQVTILLNPFTNRQFCHAESLAVDLVKVHAGCACNLEFQPSALLTNLCFITAGLDAPPFFPPPPVPLASSLKQTDHWFKSPQLCVSVCAGDCTTEWLAHKHRPVAEGARYCICGLHSCPCQVPFYSSPFPFPLSPFAFTHYPRSHSLPTSCFASLIPPVLTTCK